MDMVHAGKGRKGVNTGLYELPDDALIDERSLAECLRKCERTVRRMVSRGELPTPFKLGGVRQWKTKDVKRWIEQAADRAIKEAEIEAKAREENLSKLRKNGLL